MQLKSGRSVQDELSDILFVPKKRSIWKVLAILVAIIIGLTVVSVFYFGVDLSNYIYFLPKSESQLQTEKKNESKYETLVSRTLCKKSGDEIYTDWFQIKGDEWTIRLTSERVDDGVLANTRLWYTTSDVSMFLEAVDAVREDFKSSFIEVGDGTPNGESENQKVVEQKAYGPGQFRLRIMCWNTRYVVEVMDTSASSKE